MQPGSQTQPCRSCSDAQRHASHECQRRWSWFVYGHGRWSGLLVPLLLLSLSLSTCDFPTAFWRRFSVCLDLLIHDTSASVCDTLHELILLSWRLSSCSFFLGFAGVFLRVVSYYFYVGTLSCTFSDGWSGVMNVSSTRTRVVSTFSAGCYQGYENDKQRTRRFSLIRNRHGAGWFIKVGAISHSNYLFFKLHLSTTCSLCSKVVSKVVPSIWMLPKTLPHGCVTNCWGACTSCHEYGERLKNPV